jgi:hypothetical protein
LDKLKIRKIREIRDLLKPLFRGSMVNQNFIPKVWTIKYFLGFLVERFSICNDVDPKGW